MGHNKSYKAKVYTIIASIFVIAFSLVGYTYSFFSAVVTYNDKTQTILKANELGLVFTGVKEINVQDIIPGDTIIKTFTVENTSNRAVDFNIYMEGITNEFNEDLVYTLTDQNGTVIGQTVLPETNSQKSYLITNVEIAKDETKQYTLTIEFLYSETKDQNDLQGKVFNATLGIDTDPNTYSITASEVSYTSEYTECTDVNCAVNELYTQIVGE